jgi:hypothetical protein
VVSIIHFFNCFVRVAAAAATGQNVRIYGGLKDQDRIFTNLYRQGDPFLEGAKKRVRLQFHRLSVFSLDF